MREVTRVAAPSVFDAALDSRDRLWFTMAEGLSVNDGTKTSPVRTRLWKPRTIAAVKDALFVWSEDGQMLYRLNAATGLTESLDLRDVGFGDVFIRRGRHPHHGDERPIHRFFCFRIGRRPAGFARSPLAHHEPPAGLTRLGSAVWGCGFRHGAGNAKPDTLFPHLDVPFSG